MQASGDQFRVLEVGEVACSRLRVHDGDLVVHTHCCSFMVSICVGIPDTATFQSSFQSRTSNFENSSWQEEAVTLNFFVT